MNKEKRVRTGHIQVIERFLNDWRTGMPGIKVLVRPLLDEIRRYRQLEANRLRAERARRRGPDPQDALDAATYLIKSKHWGAASAAIGPDSVKFFGMPKAERVAVLADLIQRGAVKFPKAPPLTAVQVEQAKVPRDWREHVKLEPFEPPKVDILAAMAKAVERVNSYKPPEPPKAELPADLQHFELVNETTHELAHSSVEAKLREEVYRPRWCPYCKQIQNTKVHMLAGSEKWTYLQDMRNATYNYTFKGAITCATCWTKLDPKGQENGPHSE